MTFHQINASMQRTSTTDLIPVPPPLPWWPHDRAIALSRYDMDILSAPFVHCEGNPPVTNRLEDIEMQGFSV